MIKSNISLKSKIIIFFLIIAIVVSTIIWQITGASSNKYVESRLDGYWNMVVDSLEMKRVAKVEFTTLNFNFSHNNVELPLLQTPQIDFKGKTLLDHDIDTDSLDKYEYLFEKSKLASHGTWNLYDSKDSIKINAPLHPLNGNYKLYFFKTRFLGQEHYFMRMSNDSTYIVCEKFFSGYINEKLLKEWDSQ